MRFKVLKESLEDELIQVQKEREKQVQEVRNILLEQGFVEQRTLNGISFTKSTDDENKIVKAQMYIDITNYSYSCYISTTDETNANTTNFSSKGDENNLVTAAEQLVFQLSGI